MLNFISDFNWLTLPCRNGSEIDGNNRNRSRGVRVALRNTGRIKSIRHNMAAYSKGKLTLTR